MRDSGQRAVEQLLDWYAAEARDLPWRRTTDPYAVLVSEVMLQQTQVARVVPRYEAWLERWPSAEALAAAPLADVLREWIGLGYNLRARRLWEACRMVAERGWPEDLTELPGVGPYTAAAVGSFCFDRQEVALDTNAQRVLSRWALGEPEELLPPGRAAAFNQATMELGARVCRARLTACEECPIEGCRSRGTVAVPVPRRRPAQRFESTERYARGRVLAAVAAGDLPPSGLSPVRIERAIDGLVRDGLLIRGDDDLRLP